MASRSSGRSKKRFLPGCELVISASSAKSEFHIRDVKPVQECGQIESTATKNISNTMHDESHLLSPVSEHGQKGRDFYRNCANAPASAENTHGSNSIKRKENTYNTETYQDAKENATYNENVRLPVQEIPVLSSNSQSELTPTNSRPLQTTNFNEHDINVQICLQDERSDHDKDQSGSFYIISASDHSSTLNKILPSDSQMTIGTEISTESNLRLEDLIRMANHNIQDKQSIHTLMRNDPDSVTALINSFLKKARLSSNHELNLPSSHFLLSSLMNGKGSLDSMASLLFSSWLPSGMNTDIELKCILEAQCCDFECSKSHCLKVQQCLMKLQDDKSDVKHLCEEENNLLWHMYVHCCHCEYLHCPLYWCQKQAVHWPQNPNEILIRMKRLVEHGYHGNFLEEIQVGSFSSKDLRYDGVPREGTDWIGLCQMKGANNTIFAQSDVEEQNEYWVIKKNLMFKSQSQVELYETLSQFSLNRIAQHLWTAFCPVTNYMAVCTRYEAFSLYDRLQESPIKDLHCVVRLMIQLIITTHHLHDIGILYLNWSSKNVLYDTPEQFQLTNFTCSALKSRIAVDIEDVTLSLPRHLFAPEMLETNPDADESSDIWGLGCLLKEIFTGQPVWYDYHHETEDVLRKKMKERLPVRPDDCIALFHTFKACWEKDRSQRPSYEELQNLLLEAEVSHRSNR